MTTSAALFRLFSWISMFAIASASALAQYPHTTSPHAHAQSGEVPSLTPDEVRALRNGDGMGLARAAELNHFPGPKHLLDLRAELKLSHVQIEQVEAIHRKMKTRAIAKGEDILQAEIRLANLFASGSPAPTQVNRATEHLGVLRGQLRAIHLLAHIESARELAPGQIKAYNRLRGYRH